MTAYSSRDLRRTPHLAPAQHADRRYKSKHCLAIGIDQYLDWPRLTNAVHDASGVERVLRESFGFRTSLLLNTEATQAAIATAVQDYLRQTVEEDDLVVIFFAGHGHTERLDRDHGYIVPVGARQNRLADLIALNQFADWTSYLKSRHILYIFDSCFSGLATERAGVSKFSTDMLGRRARVAIAAGGAGQRVADGGWSNHSVFTGHLLLGLSGEASEPGIGITSTSLFAYLSRTVPRDSDQTPAFGHLPGHGGGEIVLPPLQSQVRALPISLEPPLSIGTGGGRARSPGPMTIDFDTTGISCPPIGAGVTLFAEGGRQWAIVMGAFPAQLDIGSNGEALDARDVVDWFDNPDIYGEIQTEQLFYLIDESASEAHVRASLEAVAANIDDRDSLFFYFAGHVTSTAQKQHGLVLQDYAADGERGIIEATWLVEWFDELNAKKVIAILDSGGEAFYLAGRKLRSSGRYILSSVRSMTLPRNGFVTWYVRRTVQALGMATSVSLLYDILSEADRHLCERYGCPRYHPYVLGKD